MAANPAKPSPLIRVVVPLGAIFVLLRVGGTVDLLSSLTRPLVVGILHGFGVAATDHGFALSVEGMQVPWTGDCAGLNILAVLLAVTLWVNRHEPIDRRYWLRLGYAVPAAFCANIVRILSLIIYRWVFFPSVESPQLHYFIGFIWIVPLLWLFVPRRPGGYGRVLMESLHIAAVFSLVAPFVPAPGGTLVILCALVALARSQLESDDRASTTGLLALWLAAALPIAVTSMESLWIPWLLTCPAFIDWRKRGNWALPLVIGGTIPLLAMHPVGRWVVILAVLGEAYRITRKPGKDGPSLATGTGQGHPWAELGLAVMFVFPFVATSVPGRWARAIPPPPGTMVQPLEAKGSAVRLPGQGPDLDLLWYEPHGDGRHHTLETCMRYRGIVVQPGPLPGVMTDGRYWMREFFLQDGRLLFSYREYLQRTLLPFTPAGVHVIAVVPCEVMAAEAFFQASDRAVHELDRLHRQRL